MDRNNIRITMESISKDIKFNMSAFDANMLTIDSISKNNINLLYAVIIFFVIQGCILYFVLIKSAHRIAGPIYHISRYIRDLINGKIPEVRPLRKKDELKDFHDLIIQLVESFKHMQVKGKK
jgi:signal transduction histidine kinase